MGCNYYLIKRSDEPEESDSSLDSSREKIHIGKSSAGWEFSFDTHLFTLWLATSDPRWEIVAPVYRWSVARITTHIPPIINGITSKDIFDLLNHSDYDITSEYGERLSVAEFKDFLLQRRQNGNTQLDDQYYTVIGNTADDVLYFDVHSPFE